MVDVSELKKAISGIKQIDEDRSIRDNPNIVDMREEYHNLFDLVSMVKDGYSKTLFVIGTAGLGKTEQICKWLSGVGAIRISGHITPKKLYETLWKNREGKILFFDDTESMLANQTTIVLLKQALDTSSKRIVSWDSNSGNLPKSFEFSSRVIFCLNMTPTDNGFDTILNRADKIILHFPQDKIINMMSKIAVKDRKVNGKIITAEERLKLVEWLKSRVDASVESFSLRTQNKLENYFAYSPDKWETLAIDMLNKKDEKIALLLSIMKKHDEVSEQIKEWKTLTGLSKRSYYNAKELLRQRQFECKSEAK